MLYKIASWLGKITGYTKDVHETGWYDGYNDAAADLDENGILVPTKLYAFENGEPDAI